MPLSAHRIVSFLIWEWTVFFKPLSDCGAAGVFRYPTSGSGASPTVQNPKYLQQCALNADDAITAYAQRCSDLSAYSDPNIVGIVEEYVDPQNRRSVVSIDGFVCRGEVFHFCISDNVYKVDDPDKFDSLVSPSQRLSECEIRACWAKYDAVLADLLARGVDNQFVDVEAFVLASPPDGIANTPVEVRTMEVNCRTFCNQMPIFSRLFGGESGEGCMFSAAVDLLLGSKPPISQCFATKVVIPCDSSQNVTACRHVGVCAYAPLLAGCPSLVESESRDATYYGVDGFPAHVYVVSAEGEAAARQRCDDFYAELRTKFANS